MLGKILVTFGRCATVIGLCFMMIGTYLMVNEHFTSDESPPEATIEAVEESSVTHTTHIGCLEVAPDSDANIVFSDFSDIHIRYMTDEPRSIMLQSPDGRMAELDFSGDAVTFSGDLPVDDAAKIFFESVFKVYINQEKP